MDLMEKENIYLFNEEKPYFKEDSQKAFQNRKTLEVVLQIRNNDFKQIKLRKKESISHFLVEINK